jgi:DNA-binding transcriptional regulator YiaG
MNTPKPRTNFPHNLKVLRHQKMMKSTEFAKYLGLPAKRLCEVEIGRLHPTEHEIETLSKKTGVPVDTLVKGNLKLIIQK